MHPCPVKKSQLANNYSDRKIEINLFYCGKSPFLAPQTLKTYFFYFGKSPFLAPKTLKTYSFFKNLLLLFKCEGGLGPLIIKTINNIPPPEQIMKTVHCTTYRIYVIHYRYITGLRFCRLPLQ